MLSAPCQWNFISQTKFPIIQFIPGVGATRGAITLRLMQVSMCPTLMAIFHKVNNRDDAILPIQTQFWLTIYQIVVRASF